MKKKDFMALDVQAQKEHIAQVVNEWQEQDLENRGAIVILGDRKDDKDPGKPTFYFAGSGDLLMAALDNAMKNNESFRMMASICAVGEPGYLLSTLFSGNKEE